MTAECGGAAAGDGQQDLAVLPSDPCRTAFQEGLSRAANDVGHLQRRPAHELCFCSPCREKVSASSGLAVLGELRHIQHVQDRAGVPILQLQAANSILNTGPCLE